MKFEVNGKKVERNELVKMIGEKMVKKFESEAIETHNEDPYILIQYFIGKGMLTITVE